MIKVNDDWGVLPETSEYWPEVVCLKCKPYDYDPYCTEVAFKAWVSRKGDYHMTPDTESLCNHSLSDDVKQTIRFILGIN